MSPNRENTSERASERNNKLHLSAPSTSSKSSGAVGNCPDALSGIFLTWNFSSKMSLLLRKRMKGVVVNHLLLTVLSKRLSASTRRLVASSSKRFWSYSLEAATKMTAVTASKQWIHLRRSARWPPASNSRNVTFLYLKSSSMIPDVRARARTHSSVVGIHPGPPHAG